MATMTKYPEPLIFGLDIGTRSIVGTVGYKEKDKFNVVAMAVKYHETRSMIDGQIHDISKVSEDIVCVKNQLEEQLGGRKLTEVCIAAAGRVLKTAVGHGEYEFNENTLINQEYIHSIDLIGVEKAHEIIMDELSLNKENTKYYCVGYTVVKYYLNDYEINNLEGHKGTKIAADVLATFLPEEVVSSLYSAVENSGLVVNNLTLEPIAAINVAIPENYRLLNIALVDVGAGTSDICITKDGSIIGYGMIPSAGDEMTECLIKKYLVDFNTAEKLKLVSPKKKSISYKDIMGVSHKVTPDEILSSLEAAKKNIAKKVAEKIMELNGGTSVSAVFIVGGGGKISGFSEMVAGYLKLPKERVALRGQEVMNDINILVDDIKKDSLYVTPIGICLNYFDQKNNFIFVNVNGERVKLYNNDKLTIFDAAVQYGFPKEDIFPKRGDDITFKINGKTRIVRGYTGEPAVIIQNDKEVGMNSLIEANDRIKITPSTKGACASIELASLPEFNGVLKFNVNDSEITCPKFPIVNGEPESQLYQICDGDDIEMQSYYTLKQLLTFMDVNPEAKFFINNKEANMEDKIYENFVVYWVDKSVDITSNKQDNVSEKQSIDTSNKENTVLDNIKESDDSTAISDNKSDTDSIAMGIIVNKTPVTLTGKSSYKFVDIFDFYEFDLSVMRGKKLITKINGHDAEFMETLVEGSIVDIYWEN